MGLLLVEGVKYDMSCYLVGQFECWACELMDRKQLVKKV
jgi:hypothetical protein